jgi:molybdopterin molybdotransferase
VSELDVSNLLTVAQAIEIIDAGSVSPRAIEVRLRDAAGRVLAEPIRADRDFPSFDKSQMDGFAVRAADVPGVLRIVGEVPAGQSAACGVAKGQALAIMTGAPLPEGADAVVPVEDATRAGDTLTIAKATSPGKFIARRGSDTRAGEVVLERGVRLGAAQLAVAASVGASHAPIFATPRAAVLATGDELVPFDLVPTGAQIRESNSIMLASLLARMGCNVSDLGIVRDDPELIRDTLDRAIKDHDVVFVTGGMSMGTYDYVPKILRELGVDLRITKLRIKPGKPFVFGVKQTKFVFGLPGNPVSGFVCTVRLASRLIARLCGSTVCETWSEGTLSEALAANGSREFYQPVFVESGIVRPLFWKGSADVFTLARANALLARAENEPALQAGTRVRVLTI